MTPGGFPVRTCKVAHRSRRMSRGPARQSGDVLLHETAVSWLRDRMLRTVPAEAWKEEREGFYTRLREQCAKVNDECEVGQLCRDFPKRLADLKAKKGDVLKS